MIAKIYSCVSVGIDAALVEIEADIQPGLPAMNIVGLPDASVKESKERVKSALIHAGFRYPRQRITINLVPADLKKVGTALDLPIALAILSASGQISPSWWQTSIVLGELSLNGSVRRVPGVLLASSLVLSLGFEYCIVPEENKKEAALVSGVTVLPVQSLRDFLSCPSLLQKVFAFDSSCLLQGEESVAFDFQDVRGQHQVKRAIEVACAGFHNLLMIGPPGCGKTMLAKRIPGILPRLSLQEMIESLKVYSVSHQEVPSISFVRPFRAPHHTASYVALVGGGSSPRPGEVSLSHNGVLFLDELPEFKRDVREALRQPVEEGQIYLSRAQYSVRYPARFMLVGAMNPCPCGYFTHSDVPCRCSDRQRLSYVSRVSGPLLDRIDIRVQVMKVNYDDMLGGAREESSQQIRQRVQGAWNRQRRRFAHGHWNAQMSHGLIQEYCFLSPSMRSMIQQGMQRFHLSGRSLSQILRLTRTIADLNDRDEIREEDLLEAFQYRSIDQFLLQ